MKLILPIFLITALVYAPVANAEGRDLRKEQINLALDKGYFDRISVLGQFPKISVTPEFHNIGFVEQEWYVSMVYRYYVEPNPEDGYVFIFDKNEIIGRYTPARGLSLD